MAVKNQSFPRRLSFALAGLRFALASERSFRSQLGLGIVGLAALIWLRPQAVWWALCALAAGGVLAAELFNTALEQALDRLHPDQHAGIRVAKDCAAAAVLASSLVALLIGALTLLVGLGLL